MASSWSALQVELLETGANSGTWGTLTNVNLGDAVLGEAITGSATVDFPTDADVTITLTNAATSQAARNLRLNITESGAGVGCVRNLILGSNCQIEKFYLIRNNGTGAKTIKNTSGTGVSVPAGKATLVYNDGTNVVDVLNSFSSAILGAENAGSIIPFYFANQAAFPSASTYHGAIAHSHADGAMYFAHGGSWVRMLDNGGPLGTPSSGTATNLTGLPLSTGVTGTLPIANGGTGTSSTTFANLTSNVTGTLPVANGGTGISTTTAYSVVFSGTTATGAFQASAGPGTATHVLTSNGAGALPTFQAPAAGGASLSNDTSTATNVFPIFASATSGTPTTVFTSNTKLLYKPSTGELQASELVASNGIFVNNTTVSVSYTVASGTNGFSVGPITIASGQSVTVSSGQRWVVI